MKIFVSIIILFTKIILAGQTDNEFPALTENDLQDFSIVDEKYFDGNSLWGHINGGADLYLEYGFDKLLLQSVKYKGINYRIEYYRMVDAEAAFGIFSIKRFRCILSDTLTKHICVTENQIQSALGTVYLSISNEEETEEALFNSFNLFDVISSKIKEKMFSYPDIISSQTVSAYGNSIKMFRGTLGFQNGWPMWETLFEKHEDYTVYLIPIEGNQNYFYIALIKFAHQGDQEKFISSFSFDKDGSNSIYSEGEWKQITPIEENIIVYAESDVEDLSVKKYLNNE